MTEKRLAALRERLHREGLDALLVASHPNRGYLSGFTGDSGVLVITADEAILLTDSRYTEQAQAQAPEFRVVRETQDQVETLAETLAKLTPARTGYEGALETVARISRWEKRLAGITSLVATEGLVEGLRAVKDADEVAALREATRLADAGFQLLLNLVRPGRTEREVALELEFFLRREGAEGASFEFIVASGARGSLPHGAASEKVIRSGELVTIDYGCFFHGYASDITRTLAVGKVPDKWLALYEVVRQAQEAGVAAVCPGRTGGEVDAVSRGIIAEAGYGDAFGHGLGHGVGREIHEGPRLRVGGTDVLQPGMAVTVEPGVYLPGEGGIRIEDTVLVTETGGERLTKAPRELITL